MIMLPSLPPSKKHVDCASDVSIAAEAGCVFDRGTRDMKVLRRHEAIDLNAYDSGSLLSFVRLIHRHQPSVSFSIGTESSQSRTASSTLHESSLFHPNDASNAPFLSFISRPTRFIESSAFNFSDIKTHRCSVLTKRRVSLARLNTSFHCQISRPLLVFWTWPETTPRAQYST
ncbi:hypothetical protein Nepgr_005510 [Nepenthes gracilis]|uniref:Uncharacterized protein n=1 Tax=Nepenthes gracilis TaxID=150966 RepID=A0AAD3S3G0_NEPGR|nr:hypothetical protein Nepgr_005510 [Nepenthes gracilis]